MDLPRVFLKRLNFRIGPVMANYVAAKLQDPGCQGIAVMGSDARTGVPRRQVIAAALLRADSHPREA